ncbi:flavoprotein [Dactylosporangium sp. NPDC048998]|uniref:flavoprotein n=1 Tax=Dactylosporangium sp. NPDC048998 TaxID=3363976 RepID=UPI003722914F
MADRSVTLVVCGAPLTVRTAGLVTALQGGGWQPRVVGTPAAREWLDADAVERLTGWPPQFDYRAPTLERRAQPPAALVVCPATFNTVNKAAAGAMDTYALGQICEAIGMRLPMLVVPMVNDKLWGHPAWPSSLAILHAAGVRLLDIHTGQLGEVPTKSGTGAEVIERFDPAWLVAQLDALTAG